MAAIHVADATRLICVKACPDAVLYPADLVTHQVQFHGKQLAAKTRRTPLSPADPSIPAAYLEEPICSSIYPLNVFQIKLTDILTGAVVPRIDLHHGLQI
jgi:hypothetical protein